MKLRLTLSGGEQAAEDITLSCDVTRTVAETARALISSGATRDAQLEQLAATRLAPVTLIGRPDESSAPVLLDPALPIGASGLQSGWIIEPVAEFGPAREAARVAQVAGYVEVLSGVHAGVVYSLIHGTNTIGRDRGSRIYLSDRSVSRRHAVLEVGSEIELRDLGSANGVRRDGAQVAMLTVTAPVEVQLGDVQLRITPESSVVTAPPQLTHQVRHTRSPRISPTFPRSERELPAPPAPIQPSRIPMLAMLAPVMLGGVMFLITTSPMSLMMMAFTPLMMIGSWVDGRTSGRRRLRKELQQFQETLACERAELLRLREQEIETRAAETPAFSEIANAITGRAGLLWTRRPEHRSFLEIRFGEGVLPSRTQVKLPPRGDAAAQHWSALNQIADEFREVAPVPVLERLDRCGSVGIAGEPFWAEGMARSVILQLIGLHSPAELSLAGFVGPHSAEDWEWLKWLPHVDAVTSPIPGWPLAEDEVNSTRLLTALEGILELRRQTTSGRTTVRSHLDLETRNDEGQGEAVDSLPITPTVVVLVLEGYQADTSRLISLAEDGPDFGIHLIWVANAADALPAACRTFAEVGNRAGSVSFVRSGSRVQLQRLEHVDDRTALHLARRIAPVEDTGARVLDESDLPKSVNLRELQSVDLLGGAKAIAQAWARSGSLTSQWVPGAERDPIGLSAVIGQGADGPALVDLRLHGPHALVGGTTGSGKSEFLQSWIMSLAAGVSPDRLTFLLVDYKGGAAFAECVDLPHTVGLVTDLSPHLVRRALTSLRAELRYREELLAEHGAKDLITMERRSDPMAPPTLVIVIDEFAALATEVPEFVDGVIDVAQRGRSLGLHLIMATQRPAGVIKDNLRANTNLRVALRMADEADSNDVIGVKDAAFFDPATPGRGAIKVGAGRIAHFQTGYLGARASQEREAGGIEVRSLGLMEGRSWDIPTEALPEHTETRAAPRDIEVLRDGVVAAAKLAGLATPRRPWLDELPQALALRSLRRAAQPPRPEASDRALFGLRDEPEAQRQVPVAIDFEESGNVALLGASGTGKTSALLTLAASLSLDATRAPVEIFAIDAAGGALDAIDTLPTVGAVAPLSDLELCDRVLRHVQELIAERGPRYAAARAGSLSAYRRMPGHESEARIVLLVDGFAAFRQATEMLGGQQSPFQLLNEIMMGGRAVGVHVVLTSDRASAIPASMSANVQQQFVLRLASPHDYGHLGVKSDALEDAPPGRAIIAGESDEVQIALLSDVAKGTGGPGASTDLAAQAGALTELAADLRHLGVPQAHELRNAPERIDLLELPPSRDDKAVFGIDTRRLEPVTMPASGLAVVAGPAASGLSSAALTLVAAQKRLAEEQHASIETVLLTLVPAGLRSRTQWDRVGFGAEQVAELAWNLVEALGGKRSTSRAFGMPLIGGPIGGASIGTGGATTVPPEEPTEPAEPFTFPQHGARGVIVIERPADAEDTEALPALIALAKAARRARVLVIFEFEQGTGTAIWDLFTVLKQPRWGLVLQPDEAESQSPFRESFGRVKRADFPPGRGFAVEGGRVTPMQVALAPS